MEQDVYKRLEALEREVKDLKSQLFQLKSRTVEAQRMQSIQKVETKEKPLTKYFFPNEKGEKKEDAVLPVASTAVQPVQPAKPKRSLEELFLSFLPKMFMVILVLGVLWGLKLASDYGFLSDIFKIIGGYVLAIGLFACAFIFEKKNKLSEPVVVSLLGGAYIVGILTTAAGAILYDVLSLNVALVIAFVFIGYGMAISYVKHSEALTVFVAFTSLLLPYLLEYMKFDFYLIAGYVLIITGALQIVIWKYKQSLSLYVSTFFALLALMVLANMHDDPNHLLSYGVIIVLAVFFASWEKVCSKVDKYRHFHIGLLFSFSAYCAVILTIIYRIDQIPFVVCALLASVQLAFSIYVLKKQNRDAFDVVASTIILTALAYLMNENVAVDIAQLYAFVLISLGLFVGLKLRLSLMKVVYSAFFLLISILIYSTHLPEPLFSIGSVLLVLVLIVMGAAYAYSKRSKGELTKFEMFMQNAYVMDIVPIILFLFTWSFISKVDVVNPVFTAAGTDYSYGVLRDVLRALLVGVVIILPKKWVGVALPVVVLAIFTFKSLNIHANNWTYSGEFLHQLLVRFVYIGVTLAIFVDIWKKGLIYKNYENLLKQKLDWVFVGCVLVLLFFIFNTTNFFVLNNQLSGNIHVMLGTFSIFIAAISSLIVGNRYEWKTVKYLGFTLLIFGFVKMIFFDLTSLDILVRSILFIVIGSVGLLVSNRLMKK